MLERCFGLCVAVLCAAPLYAGEERPWLRGLEPLAGAWASLEQSHPERQALRERVQARAEGVAQAKSSRLPWVDLTGSYQYTTELASMDFQLPAMAPGAPPVAVHKDLGDHDRAEAGVLASYAVFTGFAQQAAIRSSERQLLAYHEMERSLEDQLGLRLLSLHWQIQAARVAIELWESQDSVLLSHERTLQVQERNGQGIRATVLSATAERARHQAAGVRVWQGLDSLRLEFQALSAVEYPDTLMCTPWVEHWEEVSLAGVPQAENLALVRQLELQGQALAAQQDGVGAGAWPSLSVYAGWKAGNPGLAQASTEWMDYGVAGLQLQWNVFDGWARRHAEAQIQAESRALRHEESRVLVASQTAWKQVGLEWKALQAEWRSLDVADSSAREAVRLRKVGIAQGSATPDEVRDAEWVLAQLKSQKHLLVVRGRMLEVRAAWLAGERMMVAEELK